MLVVFVCVHELPNPSRGGHELARCLPHNTIRAQIDVMDVSVIQLDESNMCMYLAILMHAFITLLVPPFTDEQTCMHKL